MTRDSEVDMTYCLHKPPGPIKQKKERPRRPESAEPLRLPTSGGWGRSPWGEAGRVAEPLPGGILPCILASSGEPDETAAPQPDKTYFPHSAGVVPEPYNTVSACEKITYDTITRHKTADRMSSSDILTTPEVVRSSEAGTEPQIAASGKKAGEP